MTLALRSKALPNASVVALSLSLPLASAACSSSSSSDGRRLLFNASSPRTCVTETERAVARLRNPPRA